MPFLFDFYKSIESDFIYFKNGEITTVIFVILVLLKIRKFFDNLWYKSFINLVGTLFHEMMHFLIGFVLFARPTKISILPSEDNKIYTLGEVSFIMSTLNYNRNIVFLISILSLPIFSLYINFLNNYYKKFFGSSLLPVVIATLLLLILITNLFLSSKYSAFNFTNKTPIALAPLLLIPSVAYNEKLWDLYFYVFGLNLLSLILYIFLLIIVLINSVPSLVDIKCAFLNIGVIFWIPTILIISYLYVTKDFTFLVDIASQIQNTVKGFFYEKKYFFSNLDQSFL